MPIDIADTITDINPLLSSPSVKVTLPRGKPLDFGKSSIRVLDIPKQLTAANPSSYFGTEMFNKAILCSLHFPTENKFLLNCCADERCPREGAALGNATVSIPIRPTGAKQQCRSLVQLACQALCVYYASYSDMSNR